MKEMIKVLLEAAKNDTKEFFLGIIYLCSVFAMYYFLILIGG